MEQGARRVAEAVLGMARERGDFDTWLHDLQLLNELFSTEGVLYLLDHPDVSFGQKKVAIDRAAAARVRPESLHVLYYLVTKHRARQLSAVVRQLQGLINQVRNVHIAEVTTAAALLPDQEVAIGRSLGRRFGGTVVLEKHVDPSIVGGVVVRVGDLLLDGSVHGRLRALRERLVESVR